MPFVIKIYNALDFLHTPISKKKNYVCKQTRINKNKVGKKNL